jgi:hypothetical protein
MMEIKMSTEIGKLAEALAAAQTEFKPIHKDTENPYFNSRYADLSSVIAATQQALAKNGLVVIQSPIVELAEEKAGVMTMLAHSSGQWISNDLLLPATMVSKGGESKFNAQSVGSAITYSRRYSYQAIVGVAAEIDDDGNSASANNGHAKAPNAAGQSVADRIIEEHKAKQVGATQELIEFTPYKGNSMVMHGKGCGILASELGNLDSISIWDPHDKVRTFAKEDLQSILNVCYKYKIPTKVNAPVGHVAPPVRAVIPPLSAHVEARLIESTEIKTGTSAKNVPWALMNVLWGGERFICWDKKLWPLLTEGKGKRAVLQTTPSFDKKKDPTIEGIERIGDTTYELIDGATVPVYPSDDNENDDQVYEGTV